jgi:glycosyltransferase involved in cell wall biosynthesis
MRNHAYSLWGWVRYFIKLGIYPYLYYKRKNTWFSALSHQYDYCMRHSDSFVLLSDRYKRELDKLNIPEDAFCSIVGVNNPSMQPVQKVDFNEKEKIIAYVGRLSRWDKNPIRLLKVWRKLYKRFPDWRLQIIGSGLEHDNMLQYVEKYHLPRVCFEGQQSDVSGYYKKISVICLTSNTEGFSMSLIEGMSFGCVPVAFSNYAAVWDIIDDDINGCLVKPFDIKLYATRLAEIMSNEGKRIDMARQALEKSKIFDIENIVDKWEALFKSVYNA